MTFYKPEHEGVQSDDQAIEYAQRHVENQDEAGYGYMVWGRVAVYDCGPVAHARICTLLREK